MTQHPRNARKRRTLTQAERRDIVSALQNAMVTDAAQRRRFAALAIELRPATSIMIEAPVTNGVLVIDEDASVSDMQLAALVALVAAERRKAQQCPAAIALLNGWTSAKAEAAVGQLLRKKLVFWTARNTLALTDGGFDVIERFTAGEDVGAVKRYEPDPRD